MSQIAVDQLLDRVAQLETTDLEKFTEQVNFLLARRKTPSLSAPEAELLQKINQGLPADTQRRYDELRAKLHAETITPAEHQEFLALVDIIEQTDADRLQHLIKLSGLRQVTLPDLMHQLGIQPPPVHA
jgi:ABC-type phosphate transport system auxiliary subunit